MNGDLLCEIPAGVCPFPQRLESSDPTGRFTELWLAKGNSPPQTWSKDNNTIFIFFGSLRKVRKGSISMEWSKRGAIAHSTLFT